MIDGIQSATSGLQAYTTKIETNAHNIANLNTEGFKRDRVTLSAQAPQGVTANVEQVNTPGALVPEQTGTGLELREQSNVDLGEEIPELLRTSHGYNANLETLQTTDELIQTTIDITA